MKDLRPADTSYYHSVGSVVAATYDYTDEKGFLLYQVVRMAPKGFRQRQRDSQGAWVWNLTDVRRVLYRLPELCGEQHRRVFIVEGEKDADRLRSLGFLATTNAGGAGKWRDEYSEFLRDRHAILLPDNDAAGWKHADQVGLSLSGKAASVKILKLPNLPPKGDVSDWLDAAGTPEELKSLAKKAPDWVSWSNVSDALESVVPGAITVCLSDVEAEEVQWLWPARIPFGKVTVLEGDPGLGKSLLTLDVAARLTRGRAFPDGGPCEVGNVVILSAEDGLADTIRPRLDAADCDVSKVVALTAVRDAGGLDQMPTIEMNVAEIEEAVKACGARLVVIDPLMAYLGKKVDTYRDQDVRRALSPLATMAERTRSAVVVVRHLKKSKEGGAINAGGGSIGIIGAARSGLLVAADPEDRDRRILAPVKSNLCKLPPSLAYRVQGDESGRPFIAWLADPMSISAEQLLASGGNEEERSSREEAKDFLREFLADGPRKSPDVFRAAKAQGIAAKTLRRAFRGMGSKPLKENFEGGWIWALPAEDGQGAAKVANLTTTEKWPSSREDGHLRGEEPEHAVSKTTPQDEPRPKAEGYL